MKIRLGKRLGYELKLPADCKDLIVPSLLLQPLVENAIRHGIEPKIEGGQITATAIRCEHYLTLTVADTGVGLSDQSALKLGGKSPRRMLGGKVKVPAENSNAGAGGFGLTNLRERLDQSFGKSASVKLESAQSGGEGQGMRVTIRLPLADVEQGHLADDGPAAESQLVASTARI